MRSRRVYVGVHLARNVNEPVFRLGITIKQYKAVPYGRTYFVTGRNLNCINKDTLHALLHLSASCASVVLINGTVTLVS